jgi:hypothetical protein
MLRFAPYIAAGFLALALWGLWQYAGRLKDQRDTARAQVRSYQQVVASERALRKKLEKLRADYEKRERALRAIPDDGCLDKRIPDALGLLLKPTGEAADSGAGAEGGASDGR